jgi:MFS family permease
VTNRNEQLSPAASPPTKGGLWMAFIAAFLGWMFDGFEIGLFPLVVKPAIEDMVPGISPGEVGNWIGVMTAAYLIGAATGGVVFGWLGDRLGRVRAMSLSILTYALFSGVCGFANAPEQLFVLRFIASMGMGGEWSLGVSLVMELWPNKSRAWLAGLIGAAANVGFVIVAVVGIYLVELLGEIRSGLLAIGMEKELVDRFVSNSGWRILMICGALPALLTFFIRLFVPESQKWLEEHGRGTTKHWSTSDLLAVILGALAAIGLVSLWAMDRPLGLESREMIMAVRIAGTAIGLVIAYLGFTFPVRRYLQRSMLVAETPESGETWTPSKVLGRMIIGATLSGTALMGTWASLQNAAPWADSLEQKRIAQEHPELSVEQLKIQYPTESEEDLKKRSEERLRQFSAKPAALARARTQIWSGWGAIVGTILAALLGNWIGRRLSYCLLCVLSLGSSLLFFQSNDAFNSQFLTMVFLAGALTASFYGWLPLYLPELFPTRARAFSQGFAYNFGRIVSAVGALLFGYLMKDVFDGSFPKACTVLSFIYVIGMIVIWFAPETKGQELPE